MERCDCRLSAATASPCPSLPFPVAPNALQPAGGAGLVLQEEGWQQKGLSRGCALGAAQYLAALGPQSLIFRVKTQLLGTSDLSPHPNPSHPTPLPRLSLHL